MRGKLCVLIPAYNCASTITEVCRRSTLRSDLDEFIIVDDASRDNTFEVASRIERAIVERNPRNLGYGGTSHRLYEIALERKADFAINIHGDLGHHPEDITAIMDSLQGGEYDLVIGSRLLYISNGIRQNGWRTLLSSEFLGGMPRQRAVGQLALTWIQNKCSGTQLHCFHEGMRACTRKVVKWAVKSDLPKWYNYDTELILKAHSHGFRIGEIPTRPFYDNRSKSVAPTIRYGIRSLIRALRSARGRGKG